MRRIHRDAWYLGLMLVAAMPLAAQDAGLRASPLRHLEGEWVMTGTIAGAPTTHDVTVRWVLQRQYLEWHEVARERDSTGAPAYEAIVTFGRDPAVAGGLVAMWLDVTGDGGLVTDGFGHGMAKGDSVPFVWHLADGSGIANTFTYDAANDRWHMVIDNLDAKGQRRPFASTRLVRASP